MKRVLNDVHSGQIWRDRDKRMCNRRVRVVATRRDGGGAWVVYEDVAGIDNQVFGHPFTSKYKRFQRAFDLVSPDAR